MKFEDLSPELQEKVKACQSGEELAKLAQEQGYDLTDDQLEAISGGDFNPCWGDGDCDTKMGAPAE